MDKERHEHPAFGMLCFSRVSGGDPNLFGSSVEHNHKIQLTLKRGSVRRNLNSDWYYGKETLFEVEMSYTQFAELISAMNVGDGVPVTLRYVRGEGNIPGIELENKRNTFKQEFKAQQDDTLAECASVIDELRSLFSEKKPLNKAQKGEVIDKLTKVYNNLTVNNDFALKQFDEAMEKISTEAKKWKPLCRTRCTVWQWLLLPNMRMTTWLS